MVVMNPVFPRMFGILFICSFLSYAIGMAQMDITQSLPALPKNFSAYKQQLTTGLLVVSIVHTVCNIALLAIMFTILKAYNQVLSFVYFAAGLISTLMLALGPVCLLLPVAVSEQFIEINNSGNLLFTSLVKLSTAGHFYLYQAGMAIWGFGGLYLSYMLHQVKIVPVFFPFFGYAAYFIFIIGTIAELFGFPVGVMLSAPGGLFEISLSIWLIVKGIKQVNIV
jgi:hypothetical protein